MVAAMVLTSLSCSPVVQSPPASESGIPRECALRNKNNTNQGKKKRGCGEIRCALWLLGGPSCWCPVPNSSWGTGCAGLEVNRSSSSWRSLRCWCCLGLCQWGDPAVCHPPGGPGSPGLGSTACLLLFLEALSFPRSQMELKG